MSLKDLQDKFGGLVKEAEEILAKPELTVADQERLEIVSAEAEGIKAQMGTIGRAEGITAWAKSSAGMLPLVGMRAEGEVEVKNQTDSVLIGADGQALMDERKLAHIRSAEYKSAFRSYMRTKGHPEEQLSGEGIKVLLEGTDTAGGYLVPEDIQNRVLQKEPTPTSVSGRVTRLTTSRDAITFPKVTYTTDNSYTTPMRVTWAGEIPAAATTARVTEPTFGQVRIPIYTATMSLPVSNDLIEDSAFDLMGWVSDKFRETIDLLYENLILNGSGSGQAEGILENAAAITASVVSGAAATLTGDGLVDLVFNLPPQYDANAVLVMNKLVTAREIFQLKDGDGRYLWASTAEGGGLMVPKVRSELLGYPVVYSEFMPSCLVASNKPIIFGDLRGYFLVQRVGFSIQVLRELYAETNQSLVLGRVRFGGALVEDWRIRLQNVST